MLWLHAYVDHEILNQNTILHIIPVRTAQSHQRPKIKIVWNQKRW